ncbi:XRE family transcriptional regulator [Shouchella miscanthi]|uniref:XRE family transcriptional regulator n=1 Tax=Shouchella miscanthi TaxID=2598861 RepID=A0ABU6NKJ9_9BACI|nr:XRE family transcriptional regulator [Shouchella miscanthi]
MGGLNNNFDKTTRFVPQRLKKARLARGMTLIDLANEIGVSRQAVSQYELGQSLPKGETFIRILEVLRFPRGYFLTSEEDKAPSGPAFFRSLQAAKKKSRDMQVIRVDFIEDIRNYVLNFIELPKLNLIEPLSKDLNEITNEDIELKAKELRELWGLGNRPIKNMVKTLEKNGIVVTSINFQDDKLDALSQWRGQTPYIVLSTEKNAISRIRFNCAHELGHLVLHDAIEDIESLNSKDFKNKLEAQAHYFASCFLMPEEQFIDSLMSISLEYFIDLKSHWGASIQAMVRRCKDLELINDNQYLYLNKKISQKKWRKKEPGEENLDFEVPVIFNKAIDMLLKHELKTPEEIQSNLQLPAEEIASIFNMDKSLFQQETVPKLRIVSNHDKNVL